MDELRNVQLRQTELLETVLRLLGPLRPRQMQRFERARELIERLGRSGDAFGRWLEVARLAEGWVGAATQEESDEYDAVSEALEEFDPDRGASGRPRPLGECVPGDTTVSGSRKQLRNGSPGKTFGSWVRLDAGDLELGDSQDMKIHRVPIMIPGRVAGGRQVPKGVDELVWFEALVPLSTQSLRVFRERTLLLLDSQGFRLAVVENFAFTPDQVFQLAKTAGVSATAYRVRCMDGQSEEIVDLMFPKRMRVKKV